MKKNKSPVTNKHMAALFFVLFFIFFCLFAWNRYTINIISAFINLQLAIAFKTWDLIREVVR